jgi:hypothetical protein
MTPAQAEDLAVKLTQRWRTMGPVDELAADIETLDAGAANTAYVRLRRTATHPPSIADYLTLAHSLDMHDAGNRPPACLVCDGHGWVQAADLVQTDGAGNERRNTQVQPCRCSEGQRRAASRTWTGRTK